MDENKGKKRKNATAKQRVEFRSKTREEINKMRVPGVPYLPAPPDPNLFKKGMEIKLTKFTVKYFIVSSVSKGYNFSDCFHSLVQISTRATLC